MLKLKRKQVSRGTAWLQADSMDKLPYQQQMLFQKRNLNLTQLLYDCNNTQLRSELQLLLLVCVLAGSAPISVFPRCSSSCYDALQHCWLLTLFAWLCFAAYWELVDSSLKVGDLENKFYILESITNVTHVACIMILSLRWKHRVGAVLDSIKQFDLVSGYIGKAHQNRRCVRLQLLLMLVFYLCCIPTVFVYCKYELWKFFINFSTYVLPNVLTGISFVPYLTLMHGIARRLHCLRDCLKVELSRRASIQRAALQHLRWQHVRLLQFTKLVNQNYGLSLLLLYMSSIINFNTDLFLSYKNIDNPEFADTSWWVYISLWLIMHLCKMYVILLVNHSVQQEQTNCLTMLSNVRVDIEELDETIKHFVLQLQGNVRAHVACGLFVLDFKLITALSMITANIFIFLLQYDITFQALTKSSNGTIF